MSTIANEIRLLLGRWYSGESDRSEEQRLAVLFASAVDLPADLEPDRKLFLELRNTEADSPELPEKVEIRIEEALKAEILVATPRVAPKIPRKRRWIWAAAGIAVILCASITLIRLSGKEETAQPVFAQVSEEIVYAPGAEPEPEISEAPGTSNLIAESQEPDRKRRSVRTRRHAPKATPSSTPDVAEEDLSAEENAPANPSRYRIIRDEAEADRLLSSIFTRLDRNIEAESVRLSAISLDYDSELQKISSVEYLNRPRNEQTPI